MVFFGQIKFLTLVLSSLFCDSYNQIYSMQGTNWEKCKLTNRFHVAMHLFSD